jgi:hypothetical protein
MQYQQSILHLGRFMTLNDLTALVEKIRSRATTPIRATCSQPTALRIANISRWLTRPAPRPSKPCFDRSKTVTSWPAA